MSGSGISWAICKSASRSRQITMPAPHRSSFFTGWMPFLPPNQQRQSTEGTDALISSSLDLNEARDDGVLGCSGISWTTRKQPAPRSRQTTTSAPHHSICTGRMLILTNTDAGCLIVLCSWRQLNSRRFPEISRTSRSCRQLALVVQLACGWSGVIVCRWC